MLYTIENNEIKLTVSDQGGEMMSLQKDGCEYLWQGDPAYWAGRSPNLFPICGRLTDGKYTFEGNTYEMILHGFARLSALTLETHEKDRLVFLLRDSEETRAIYPFSFEYRVAYTLSGSSVLMNYSVKNTGDNALYFAFGAHPGFRVPLDNGSFTDYRLEFASPCLARALVFDSCYLTDETQPFALKNGTSIPLSHDLFDNDAIFLYNTARRVTLKSDLSARSVTVDFPDMPYIGFWHRPQTDSPYVCIEPWQSVPAYYKKVDELEKKRDMFLLDPGKEQDATITITLT